MAIWIHHWIVRSMRSSWEFTETYKLLKSLVNSFFSFKPRCEKTLHVWFTNKKVFVSRYIWYIDLFQPGSKPYSMHCQCLYIGDTQRFLFVVFLWFYYFSIASSHPWFQPFACINSKDGIEWWYRPAYSPYQHYNLTLLFRVWTIARLYIFIMCWNKVWNKNEAT